MRLADLVRPEWIATDLRAPDRDSALGWIADRLEAIGAIPDAAPVRAALIAREASHTTAMGHGMAIPHTRVEGLDAPVLMVVSAKEPIRFAESPVASIDDPDADGTVRLFFVLLSPPGHEGHHIKTLARIARLTRDPNFIEGILSAESESGVHEAILRVDGEHV